MNCEDCRALIEDFVEAELDEQLYRLTAAHIIGCAGCEQIHMKLKRERGIYSRYLLNVEATPALWHTVEAAIDEVKAAHATRWLPRPGDWLPAFLRFRYVDVVLLLLAAVLTITIVKMSRSPEVSLEGAGISESRGADRTPPPSEPTSASVAGLRDGGRLDAGARANTPPGGRAARGNSLRATGRKEIAAANLSSAPSNSMPSSNVSFANQLVHQAEQDYLVAIEILSQEIKRQATSETEEIKQLRRAVAVLDRTIADTRLAVRKHSADPVSVQHLVAAYSRKIDLLKGIIDLLEAT